MGVARLAGVESVKREKREKYGTEKYISVSSTPKQIVRQAVQNEGNRCPKWGSTLDGSRKLKASKVVKTLCCTPVSRMRLAGVQNGGPQRTQWTKRTGGEVQNTHKAYRTYRTHKPHEKCYAVSVSRICRTAVQNGGSQVSRMVDRNGRNGQNRPWEKPHKSYKSYKSYKSHKKPFCSTGVQNVQVRLNRHRNHQRIMPPMISLTDLQPWRSR